MNCPNCKKDLVAGFDCVDCRDILTQPIVVEEIKTAFESVQPIIVEDTNTAHQEELVEPVVVSPEVIKRKRGRPSKK